MAHRRKESLKEIVLLQSRIEQYFESDSSFISAITRTWSPQVDVYETDNEICLFADLPGVDKNNLKIDVHDNFITIQGQRKLQNREGENFIQMERSYGPFQRTFRLSAPLVEKSVVADIKNGVLTIKMKKDARPGPEYVRVKIESDET